MKNKFSVQAICAWSLVVILVIHQVFLVVSAKSVAENDSETIQLASLQTKDQKPKEESSNSKKNKLSDKELDWNLIALNKQRKITKVRFIVYGNKKIYGSIIGDNTIDVTTSDPIILKTVTESLSRPMRFVLNRETDGFAGSDFLYGEIKVTTTKDSFSIGIARGGFVLSDEYPSNRSKFLSWMLAKQLDDVVFSAIKEHISLEVFKSLTGEKVIQGGQIIYYKLRNRVKLGKGQ